MRKRKYATAKFTKLFTATIAVNSGDDIGLRVIADNWGQAEITLGLWIQKEHLIGARIFHLQEMTREKVITLTTATEEV